MFTCVFKQTYKNIEVIIVDNESIDKTINRAKKFDVKIISIKNFSPGKAITMARVSNGDISFVFLIVFLLEITGLIILLKIYQIKMLQSIW